MKFELTDQKIDFKGNVLYRICAVKDFGNVKKGDLGGWVQSDKNLSHVGDCWIYADAKVFQYAKISDNAFVSGNSLVFGSSLIAENSKVTDSSCVSGISRVYKNSHISGTSLVKGNSHIFYNLESANVEVIEGNGYNINYSGFDPISKEHFIRVDCQTHSMSVWKDSEKRNEIMDKNKFPKHLEKECLQILSELERIFVKENV